MISYLERLAIGPDSIGFKLDLITVGLIFFVVIVMAGMILCNGKLSVKEKFSLVAKPLSLIFIGLALSVTLRLNDKGRAPPLT